MPITEAFKAAIAGMTGSPIAIALLTVNVAFLVFVTLLLKDVAENASTRDKAQTETIMQILRACKP
jgi:hypothetical protein